MKQYLMLLMMGILPVTLQATEIDCSEHQIYCNMIALRPNLDKDFAMKLSNHIYKYSKQFGTDPMLSVAIAFQESSLANVNRRGSVLTKSGEVVKGITDVGVFQIHIATAEYLNIDFDRLISDIEYQTYWHTRILADKIKTCTTKREKLKVSPGNEWSCYHSFTFDKRKIYLNRVGEHLAKLK